MSASEIHCLYPDWLDFQSKEYVANFVPEVDKILGYHFCIFLLDRYTHW